MKKFIIAILIFMALFLYWREAENDHREPTASAAAGYASCTAKGNSDVNCYRWYYGD